MAESRAGEMRWTILCIARRDWQLGWVGAHKLLMSAIFFKYIVCNAKSMITAQMYVLTSLPTFVTTYHLQR